MQNKVEPAEARALLAQLEAQFVPRDVTALGLDWWEYLGGPWRPLEHFAFAPAADSARQAASASPGPLRVERVHTLTHEAEQILGEYYEAVDVVQRDGVDSMQKLLQHPPSAMWLAYLRNELAGCVVLRGGLPDPEAGECKRLFVRPAFRGAGVAAALMDTLEIFASEAGLQWVYLDTNDAFTTSVALYRRRGYQPCPRYNDNPQATLFFRKPLRETPPASDPG